MTNKEYIEKNNISFLKAMKMWDNKTCCIDDWLNQEHHRFKVGDFVIFKGTTTGIGIVVEVADYVYYKFVNRDGEFCGNQNDPDVLRMIDESSFKKIF